ncbi:MAG: hypothetical protein FJ150_06700 [Euryarchaeota archaeon]|nr:hypothetical protein [Euryarchaeota archaeon]
MFINIPLFCTLIAIAASFYAGYSDITRGIIPNKLTFPLIGLGIVLNGIYAFISNDPYFLIKCIIYTSIIFALGYAFWRLGAWAGGDVKLFTALSALIPFYPSLVTYNLFNVNFPVVAAYPFPFTLIINSILSILPFLLIYVIYIVLKYKKHLRNELFKPITEVKKNLVLTLAVTSSVTITLIITQYFTYQVIIVSLILIYLLSLVISKLPNRIKAIIISAVTVYALYKNFEITVSGIILVLISITLFEVIKKLLTTVNKEALQDDFEIKDLKEGMIPAYNMYKIDDEIYFDDKGFFQKAKEAIKRGNLTSMGVPKGKLLIGSMAAGLTNEDLKLLENLLKTGKINDRFKIKKGVPFAPSIFIGLVISIFIGDLAFIIQKIIYSIFI